MHHPFSYHKLLLARNFFDESNLLGGGGFSYVYKAILFNDNVAIKVFNMDTEQKQLPRLLILNVKHCEMSATEISSKSAQVVPVLISKL